MTDIKDDSPFTPDTSKASNAPSPQDQGAAGLKSSILADAHDLSDGAKHLAGDAMAQARESAQSQISSGKDRLAEGLGNVAEAIRQTGEQLREGEQTGLTEYVTRAADGVEAASDYLKEKSISDVLGDVGGFARREPAMFIGGAFVLGLLGGRFLKSSHAQRPATNGGASNAQASARTKPDAGRRNSQGSSSNKSPSRGAMSSGTRPIAQDRPSELGSTGGAYRAYDDGAKLPGTV